MKCDVAEVGHCMTDHTFQPCETLMIHLSREGAVDEETGQLFGGRNNSKADIFSDNGNIICFGFKYRLIAVIYYAGTKCGNGHFFVESYRPSTNRNINDTHF